MAEIGLRAGLAVILLGACLAAWGILGRLVLANARKARGGMEGPPVGFERGRPGLIVFGSPRCAPCVYAQKPAARRLELELGGAIQIVDIDVTEQPLLAERYGIVSLPTVFVLDADGAPRRVNHGVVTTAELRRQIAPFLA